MFFSTERYESFNSVTRSALIHSNRQAPSHDAARAFAGYDRVKHIMAGGAWQVSGSTKWETVSPNVLEILNNAPTFHHMLGIPKDVLHEPGTSQIFKAGIGLMILIGKIIYKRRTGIDREQHTDWENSLTFKHAPVKLLVASCREGESVVAKNGDIVQRQFHALANLQVVRTLARFPLMANERPYRMIQARSLSFYTKYLRCT